MVTVREATPADADAIAALHRAAFAASSHGYAGEDELVAACEDEGEVVFSDVATAWVGDVERVIGHALWSGMHPADQPGVRGMLCVGPIAVLPGWQGRGVGSALLRRGIAQARDARVAALFVLGDPAYYGRFGFRPATDLGFGNAYDAGDAFHALPLRDPLPLEWQGTVVARAACFQPDALAALEARHKP
ncbi:MAG: N-acetyltransferase [Planctomycetota bacterium]